MWWSLIVLLLLAVATGHAANSTDEDTAKLKNTHVANQCKKKLEDLFHERKTCINKFITYQTGTDTNATSETDNNCTNLDVMAMEFTNHISNSSQCFNYDIEIINHLIKVRLEALKKLQNDPKTKELFKDFLQNNGTKCIKENGKIIQDKCLRTVLTNETLTRAKRLKSTLYRVQFLDFDSRSCSKSSTILDCAADILKTRCSEANTANFVLSLQGMLTNDLCNITNNASTEAPSKVTPKKSSSGIIIGVLVGIIALLVLALFATKKIKKCSTTRTESYRVSYQHQSKGSKDVEHNEELHGIEK